MSMEMEGERLRKAEDMKGSMMIGTTMLWEQG